MEDNVKQNVKLKQKITYSKGRPDDVELTRSENEEETNSNPDVQKKHSSRPERMSSKSDNWFIVNEKQSSSLRMIIPQKNSHRLYFSCGDLDTVKLTKWIPLTDDELMKRIKPCQDYDNKIIELQKYLGNNEDIVDLKITMYISACNQHCLSPYPNYIIEESSIGMESLSLINEFIPPVGLLKHYLNKTGNFSPNENVVNVLHWLLVTFSEPNLSQTGVENFDKILDKVDHLVNKKYPHNVFVLKYKRINENLWQTEKKEMASKFAFLPLNMEHAHSIMHLGVHPKIFTDGVYGPGIYLTTDLLHCLQMAPTQWVWGKSILGIEMQVILMVEFINHPNLIIYTMQKALCNEQKEISANNGKLYYLPSHKFVKARYLMLFVKTQSSMKYIATEKYEGNKMNVELCKQTILYATIILSIVILAKRFQFGKVAKNLFTSIAGGVNN